MLRPQREDGVDYSLDRFPEGELDLTFFIPQVFENNADGQLIEGPEAADCLFPWEITDQGERISWEVYTGSDHANDFVNNTEWTTLNGTFDETAALSQSGHVYLNVPGNVPAVSFNDLDRAFWLDLNLRKPPASRSEFKNDYLAGDIDAEGVVAVFEAMNLPKPPLNDPTELLNQLDTAPFDFSPASQADQEALQSAWEDSGYDAPPISLALHWFRARLTETVDEPIEVRTILMNTVRATAAVTRVEEVVGTSDGRPNQTFTLQNSPVLVDTNSNTPVLELEIEELESTERWEAVTDFFGVEADQAAFLFEPDTGLILFGDGEHGRIPVAGSTIVARTYRYGGGEIGNVGEGAISAIRSALVNVDSVTNERSASGGANAETLDEVKLRAPHTLRTRERAVTADDFADLARRTPGVRIQRSYALPLTRIDNSATPPLVEPNSPGAVTVIILPENKEETPQPTEDQLRLVCNYLNQRRLITTELYVSGPSYTKIATLSAELTVQTDADLKTVQDEANKRLLNYFHPLNGGENQSGWPFGQSIYYGSVFRQLLQVAGVIQVLCLHIEAANGGVCDDVLAIPEGHLVHLPPDVINLQVRYDTFS